MAMFRSFDDALAWAKMHGRDNCRPCDKWNIVELDCKMFAVEIVFRSSGDRVGYAV